MRPALLRQRYGLFWLLLCWMVGQVAAQPYVVTLPTMADAELNQALMDVSNLVQLQQGPASDAWALRARARADQERFNSVLRSFGYYRAQVEILLDGVALDAPEAAVEPAPAAAEQTLVITVLIRLGPLSHLRQVQFTGDAPAHILQKLGVLVGEPARAQRILALRTTLLQELQAQGFMQASVSEAQVFQVPEQDLLDVFYTVKTGPLVNLGTVRFSGLERVNEAFLRQHLLLQTGQRFKPAAIEAARQDLADLGVFSAVRARAAEQVDQQQRMAVDFAVTERARRAVNLGANYYTDQGGSLSLAWQHRNLFGNAEHLNLNAAATQLGGNSTFGIGYQASIGFSKPDFLLRQQSLQSNLRAVHQHLLAYDQTALIADVLISHRLSQHWRSSLGLAAEQAQIIQAGDTYDYTLLSLPWVVNYDDSNDLLEPTQGMRASASFTPTQPLAGNNRAIFVQAQLAASLYYDFNSSGRSVLALRGVVSDTGGVSRFALPPDKRAYAGGSASVRGYKYQSIGPRFADNSPQGGMAMAAGTLEFRQRLFADWGGVMFVDAGQVNASGSPFASTWRLGAGVGVRYYTSFGPIRFDVAVPLNPQPESGSFQLYVSIGQAF